MIRNRKLIILLSVVILACTKAAPEESGATKAKVSVEKTHINTHDLLNDKYLLLQKGKKNYYLVKAI